KGTAEIQHRWKGATWQFASLSNRDMFAGNPEKYAPQYGSRQPGVCLWRRQWL
ncbi:MAG TPA: YHS domain-containing protein, partial [Candidatus Handelsmanbacteria bacterium]|nr:YHS domain-containing protein [Candidatus Handelsmanbacteria bacterium]